MTNEAYVPISCEDHSEYELAIMRRDSLNVTWQNEQGESRDETLKPYDLLTEQKVEYLLAKDLNGEPKKIRLDKIIEAYVNNE